jgi:hypothetical protein
MPDETTKYKAAQIRLLAENERLRVHLKTVRRALGLSEDIGDGKDIIPAISKLRQSAGLTGLGDDHPLASTFGCMKDEPLWDELMRDEPTVSLRSSRLALAQAVIEAACKAVCWWCKQGHKTERADDEEWIHIGLAYPGWPDKHCCHAAAIRSLNVSAIAGAEGDEE